MATRPTTSRSFSSCTRRRSISATSCVSPLADSGTGLEQGKFDQFSPESIHRAIKCVTEADLQEQLRALPNYKELANCQFYQFTLKECMPFFHEEHLQIFDLLKAEIMESEEKHRLFR